MKTLANDEPTMILKTTIFSLAALALLFILRFTPLWDSILSSGSFKPVDFNTLSLPKKRNWILVCPEGFCPLANSPRTAPVFDRQSTQLADQLKEIILSEGNATVRDDTGVTLDVVIRTPILRWPDLVSISYVELPDNLSSIAIFSRSIYGRSDLGANKARIKRWLEKLEALK